MREISDDRTNAQRGWSLEAEVDKNVVAIQERTPGVSVKDYAFVAMRKVRDRPFRIPIQRLYAA